MNKLLTVRLKDSEDGVERRSTRRSIRSKSAQEAEHVAAKLKRIPQLGLSSLEALVSFTKGLDGLPEELQAQLHRNELRADAALVELKAQLQELHNKLALPSYDKQQLDQHILKTEEMIADKRGDLKFVPRPEQCR